MRERRKMKSRVRRAEREERREKRASERARERLTQTQKTSEGENADSNSLKFINFKIPKFFQLSPPPPPS